ncbi:hypothetical protein SSBR45G_65860 [Bradyrhizobium sp. SSBR45G]|uniref:hypothetical protein n=1 Tax=unclassified Bradyrhizobium TaxID=2631580 RepID=UPI002342AE7C|nr:MULTISPECIES: hypothetical protein [unclassified Bradyrhizobium]GLH81677.1 hypothetical protein SSBR45G_65860 [Bradyrhizobium sp. SSBR45G]GLH89099.1 hypothetical protein SSBR45R_65600 [Bradyrhizobium sp. SSBR45R]
MILSLLALPLLSGGVAAQTGAATAPSVCSKIGEDGAGEREAACLRELRGRVSRTGEVLSIRLETGQLKTYRNDQKSCDNDDAQHCIHHVLLGYHPESRVYAIGMSYYEGSSVQLLSARTGATLGMRGVPHFTPDGTRFVVIDNDYAYGGEDDLAIGSFANGELSMDWHYRSENGPREWRFERWTDNDHVALQVFPADSGKKCPLDDCKAFLVRFGSSWMVRPSPLPW